ITNSSVFNNTASTGGGIYLAANGNFTGCTINGNTANSPGPDYASGIMFDGSNGRGLRLVNCTVSGNTTNGTGFTSGSILNLSSNGASLLELINCTIANNNNTNPGAALATTSRGATGGTTATTTIRNSIFGNNTPGNLLTSQTIPSGPATITSLGNNI